MEFGNWKETESKFQTKINEIFRNYNLMELSNYQKREIIFDYLCNTLNYDYELLEKIKNQSKGNRLHRNPYYELKSVIDNNIGICNAISQYYKFLLEQVGIKSYCVICDDGTDVKHQLVIVYDDENNVYSFDDVTSVIVGRGDKDTFFDYDIEVANKNNQGTKEILKNDKWLVLDDEYVSFLVGRDFPKYPVITELPSNIERVKTKNNYHF